MVAQVQNKSGTSLEVTPKQEDLVGGGCKQKWADWSGFFTTKSKQEGKGSTESDVGVRGNLLLYQMWEKWEHGGGGGESKPNRLLQDREYVQP